MEISKKAEKIFSLLDSHYAPEIQFLQFKNNYELLITVILTAQTTDEQVMKVTPVLFAKFPTPELLAKAEVSELEDIIHSTGFFHAKARNIKAAAQMLCDKYHGIVPDTIDELVKIPGAGRKTANVIIGTAFNKPAVIVDTHFKRVAYRLGLTKNTEPEKVEFDIRKILREEHQYRLSMTVNLHGRKCCYARNPDCKNCILSTLCDFYSSCK